MSNNEKVSDNLIHGTTKSGFEYWIDKRVMNDWRFVTLTGKIATGSDIDKIVAVEEALRLLFGDSYGTLLSFIAEKNDGYVPSEKVVEEFVEIIGSTKNSDSSLTA